MGSRQCKPVWKTYQEYIQLSCGYIVSGHWKGRNLDTFSQVERSASEAARERTRSQVAEAARTSIAATRYARTFFHKLSAGYQQEVVEGHGDHIPLRGRDDSVVLFWLPEILPSRLVRRPLDCSREEGWRFWQAKSRRLPYVTAYVEAQLWAFDWPGDEGYKRQYRDLMSAWSRLSEEDDIAKQVFLAEGRFNWLVWWKLSHTDPRFLPSGCEAIFAVYHFMGMVGVSEARAESIASSLKRYQGSGQGRPVSTDRIIENHGAKLWSERFEL